MDIELARTFLEIVRSGSFVAAAQSLHCTQTAITARIKNLESRLDCQLLVRNRSGAKLTANGEAFVVHANQMVQTWDAAKRDLPLPNGYHNTLHIGGEVSLCNPLMLSWVRVLREQIASHTIRADVADGQTLLQQLELGLLDAALVFQPSYNPNLQVEQLVEEKLILVSRLGQSKPYIYVDWGDEFRRSHDTALPDKARASLNFNLGTLALQYLLENGGSGYFRTRVVQHYLDNGVLERVPQAPEFNYPIYLVYPRARNAEVLQQAYALLREVVASVRDWSQRWPSQI